jgi:hypothetical protein
MRKLVIAALSAAALVAAAGPALADPANASNYWERQRLHAPPPATTAYAPRPYALRGDGRRSDDGAFTARVEWMGGGRDRRVVFDRAS